MVRDQIDYWCSKGILLVLSAMLVFAILATGAVRSLEWAIVQGLATVLLVLWFPRLLVRRDYRFLWSPLSFGVALFAGYAIYRSLEAPVPFDARAEATRVLVYALFFFAILDNLHGQEDLLFLVLVLIGVATLVSLYAVFQFVTDSPWVWHFVKPEVYAHRGSGTYICPNHLAGLLEMLVPLSLACVVTGRFHATLKVFLGYAALAMIAGIAVTISRGGWLATSVPLIVFFAALLRTRTYRLPALALVVLLAVLGYWVSKSVVAPQRFFNRVAAPPGTQDIRFQLWKPALAVWKENEWFGAGPAHFDHAFRKHRPDDIQMRPLYVHNDYLNTLADYGTIGLSLVGLALALFGVGLVRVWKFVRRSNDVGTKPSNRSALVYGSALGLLAMLIHSVVDFNMHIPANALVAVTLMAVASAHLRFASERFWWNPGMIGRGLLAAGVLAGAGVLGQGTGQQAVHEWWIRAAAKAPENRTKVDRLAQAAAASPTQPETASEVAETLRLWSWIGAEGNEALTREAMSWFETAMKLNPLDPFAVARYGMCLDRLGEMETAEPYFARAVTMDPKNYYIVGLRGWHDFQRGRYADAKVWFEESRRLAMWRLDAPVRDDFPSLYLRLIEQRLAEQDPAPANP